MVYFVCEVCNETLKKNKVEVHASRCRGFWAVSCVDCSQVFEGSSYAAHTSCISEARKYEGSLYREKAKRKQNPQKRWMEIVSQVAAKRTDKSTEAQLLINIAAYDNVPRKKAKFINFLKNSLAFSDIVVAEKIFQMYEQQFKAEKKIAQKIPNLSLKNENTNGAGNGKSIPGQEISVGDVQIMQKSDQEASAIPWIKLIRKVLSTSKDCQMEYKLLRQHVVDIVKGSYHSALSQEELKKKFKAASKSSKLRCSRIVKLHI
uniref:Uncharacterized protein AlNc14C158G7714 n=1 Tax=Albugo laibachii Nc14 TaxID=890382 RepID=F0WMM7_9STRA|nr:conserved hypothetical protein [Albugo laibachii Nc14]|eukprot:CCA22560.1 conserved hypothetical protein [Albugo laibachii Nc14]